MRAGLLHLAKDVAILSTERRVTQEAHHNADLINLRPYPSANKKAKRAFGPSLWVYNNSALDEHSVNPYGLQNLGFNWIIYHVSFVPLWSGLMSCGHAYHFLPLLLQTFRTVSLILCFYLFNVV